MLYLASAAVAHAHTPMRNWVFIALGALVILALINKPWRRGRDRGR